MSDSADRSTWHNVALTIPFPSPANAELVKRVVEVDKPLRPSELSRTLTVDGSSLIVDFRARTVAQARVALDHCLSDIQLVVQTMHKFAPKAERDEEGEKEPEAPSLEVGLKGSWDSVAR
ncbi:transcription factor Pcc1-domain-containing protein [Leucosporidium creatinivorum]|uniref:Transcription factor Pcc1-domain-containing protein n=1 Tax=Leucosporidium creatinivorum TaxID=106004 RepID=A0A1Y2F8R9_9BASI|nr:transcription factor Pcc1-domain-containing protein [Leucosporidium creatinivorum]